MHTLLHNYCIYLTYPISMKTIIETSGKSIIKARTACLKKFLFYFKKGFKDTTYIAWERQYKEDASLAFQEKLNKSSFLELLEKRKYMEIAMNAVRIESRTNLLFSFEKMALRDAVSSPQGAKIFALGLYEYIYGDSPLQQRFELFSDQVSILPRKQTRVFTWPVTTIFGFIGNPREHMFLKPRVTQIAAEKYQYDFHYSSRPDWKTYKSLLDFSQTVKKDTLKLHPKDNIDLQSFIWVMGSEEYPD